MKIIERYNQRARENLVLSCDDDGTPLCPFCNARMATVVAGPKTTFENCLCPCWRRGENDGLYTHQVVVACNAADEFAYRTTCDNLEEQAEEEEKQKEFQDRLRFSKADPETRFNLICERRYLYGKHHRKARSRVRVAIARGADFDQSMNA